MDSRILDSRNELAKLLIQARNEANMTQKELGEITGINQADISRIERGKANPSLDTIVRLVSAMHKSIKMELAEDSEHREGIAYKGKYKKYLPKDKLQGDFNVNDFDKITESKEVELVDGAVYDKGHRKFYQKDIIMALHRMIQDYYRENNRGGAVYAQKTFIFGEKDSESNTSICPDILYVKDESCINDDKWISGSPDLVIEVISSDENEIAHVIKRRFYQKSGVREYWVLNTDEKSLTVYQNKDSYENNIEYSNDIVGVDIFEGDLKINLKGLWRFIDE